MRSLMALSLLLSSTAIVMSAEIKATSRIDAVTVYPAGAEVTRTGRLTMEGGEHVILFTDLPAQAVSGSIRVEGKATGALQIGSVDTRRVSVPRTDEAITATERKQIENAIEKLNDERAVLQAAVEAAQAQKALINNLAQMPTQPPSPHATASQPDWSQLFSLIGQRSAEAQKTILEAQIRIRETDRQIADLTRKLASLAPAPEHRTEVKVFVSAAGALDADLIIRYQVGTASWTPFYDARLSTGTRDQAPGLQLIRRASIQQRTGENWDDVQLSLSTARPSAGSAAPDLRPMTVDYAPDAPPPQAAERGPRPHSQTPASATDNSRTKLQSGRYAAEERPATVEAQPFQAVYAIAGRVAVPSTGEMKRVQIDDMALNPTLTVRTVPKAEAKAYLYAKLTMAAGTPVLPGSVALFRDFNLRRQRPAAAARARRGARAWLRRRRHDPRAPCDRGGRARRERMGLHLEDRRAQLSHHREELAPAADPATRARPDPGVAERGDQDRPPRPHSADAAQRRRQARRHGVGHDACARRGEGRRVRLSGELAGGEEGHLRAGLVSDMSFARSSGCTRRRRDACAARRRPP